MDSPPSLDRVGAFVTGLTRWINGAAAAAKWVSSSNGENYKQRFITKPVSRTRLNLRLQILE
ncbi:hypothetical protein SAY87_013792 [Trapa incisa]|uniref:Uncharacterized protein n=1 Tax=Trapa incisa TaxID=236973 RepID=A0AAN7KG31_9MYRT|nr:hypothetical protein SAY87_013792 [Trapa incisa]